MKTFLLHVPSARKACTAFIESLPPGRWRVDIAEQKRRRSVEQNARHWALLTCISDQFRDEIGRQYSPETWHEYFKAKFLGKDTVIVDGDVLLVPKESKKLNVVEFGDLMARIEVWAHEHDIQLFTEEQMRESA